MKIEIPFNDWSKERLGLSVKNAKSRNKKYGNVGDTFIVGESVYMLDLVVKLPLWFIAQELWRTEGCICDIEFMGIWEKIHPRKGWVDNQEVWYHHFKEI